MRVLTVSEVARRIGLRPSAIRYYEQIGILPAADRVSGQRRYDSTVLHRLAVVKRAQQTGFSLEEIRRLFFGFREGTSASRRWRKLSQQKLVELETQREQIKTMERLLRQMTQRCHCHTLAECGKALFETAADGANETRSSTCRRKART